MRVSPPLHAAILIGGRSSRMGYPKHLIRSASQTWLERTVQLLKPIVAEIVLAGAGEVPSSCLDLPRLPDASCANGPLAGILSVMRSEPIADWLILACDMPAVTEASLSWLLQNRNTRFWGRVPRFNEKGFYEPLFALYKAPAIQIFEDLFAAGESKVGLVARHSLIETPLIPVDLCHAWQNINTPEELERFRSG